MNERINTVNLFIIYFIVLYFLIYSLWIKNTNIMLRKFCYSSLVVALWFDCKTENYVKSSSLSKFDLINPVRWYLGGSLLSSLKTVNQHVLIASAA